MQLVNPITLRDKIVNALLDLREDEFETPEDFIDLNKCSDAYLVQMLIDTANELRFDRNKARVALEDIQLTQTL